MFRSQRLRNAAREQTTSHDWLSRQSWLRDVLGIGILVGVPVIPWIVVMRDFLNPAVDGMLPLGRMGWIGWLAALVLVSLICSRFRQYAGSR